MWKEKVKGRESAICYKKKKAFVSEDEEEWSKSILGYIDWFSIMNTDYLYKHGNNTCCIDYNFYCVFFLINKLTMLFAA